MEKNTFISTIMMVIVTLALAWHYDDVKKSMLAVSGLLHSLLILAVAGFMTGIEKLAEKSNEGAE